jgi:hypothetical protein
MFRIIRKTTLDELTKRADRADELGREADRLTTDLARVTDSAIRTETVAERQLKDLAQAYADNIGLQRVAAEARAEAARARAEADQQIAEIRDDVMKLREAAADTETGATIRGAIAYRLVKDLMAEAAAATEGAELRRPFDIAAMVLGFDLPPVPDTGETPVTARAEHPDL